MQNQASLLSTGTDDWRTPRALFGALHREFDFTVDAAADQDNHLVPRYWTAAHDGAARSWAKERVWCNPPYSRGRQPGFLARAAKCEAAVAVLLIPARPDTRAWHEHVWEAASEVRFIRGRVRFEGATSGAPFPSAIVVYRAGGRRGRPALVWPCEMPDADVRRCMAPWCDVPLTGRADQRTCSDRCRQVLSRLAHP